MPKTRHASLLPAALMSVLVGLAGCHISFGSSSSSQSPGSVHGKPAKKSPSQAGRASKPTSKPIPKTDSKTKTTADSKPASDPVDDKTSEGPHRDKPDTNDPKRTQPTNDPVRTPPSSEPTRMPKHLGGAKSGGAGDPEEPPAEDAGGAKGIDRPGSLTAPK